MTVTYLLVRHGEAEGNQERRFIGQSDVPLSRLGRQQAAVLSDRLATTAISGFIASDLQRAHNTVAGAAASLGLQVVVDQRLREINNGEWQDLLPHEVEAAYPDLWGRYVGGEDVPRPGGERWVDVQRRTLAALEDDLATRSDGDTVVVGTHGGPVLSTVLWAAGLSIDGNIFTGPFQPVSNASITTIELPAARLIGVNDIGHLGELARSGHVRELERRERE